MSTLRDYVTAYDAGVLSDDEVTTVVEKVRSYIKVARTRRGIGQKKLEKESGVDQPTISRIEKSSIPTLPILVRLVDGLGLSLAAFFLQAETGAKSAVSSPLGASAPVEATGAEGTDATTLRRIGSAFFAAAAHAATSQKANRSTHRARPQKPKTSRGAA